MQFHIEAAFRNMCQRILAEHRTTAEWSQAESDDMFQNGNYIGGFDADEQAFCFSIYLEEGEFWFQVSPEELHDIVDGRLHMVNIRRAE